MQEKYREAYALTRMNLEEAAQRRKSEYDVKVKPAQFEIGQNVWYYYPRRYTSRSPKWSKNYDGPFVITKVIPPCNYIIQRNKRSKPQVVHQEKLKVYHAPNPANWKEPDRKQKSSISEETSRMDTEVQPSECQYTSDIFDADVNLQSPTEKRRIKPSVRFQDYYVDGPKNSSPSSPRETGNLTGQAGSRPESTSRQTDSATLPVPCEAPQSSYGQYETQPSGRPTYSSGSDNHQRSDVSTSRPQKRTRVPLMRFLDYLV